MKVTFFIIISAIIVGFFIGRFFVPSNDPANLEINDIKIAIATVAIDTQDSELKVFRDIFVSPNETMLSVLERLAEQEVVDFTKTNSGFVLENKQDTDTRNWTLYKNGEKLSDSMNSIVEPGYFFELQYEIVTSTAQVISN